MKRAALRAIATASLAALIVLCLAWEIRLAPLRPGGSWWAIKALPLALPFGGVLAGRRYTYQWSSMLMLAYFVEGVMRGWTERGLSQTLAAIEVVLSLVFVAAAVGYARLARGPAATKVEAAARRRRAAGTQATGNGRRR